MPLSRFKWKQRSAEKEFVNRIDSIELFNFHLNQVIDNTTYLAIINYYGHGGIGKSSLKAKIHKNIDSNSSIKFELINLDLGLKELENFVNGLILLRKQINKLCPLFDLALGFYWNQTNSATLNENYKKFLKSKVSSEFSKLIADIIIGVSPIQLIEETYTLAKGKYDIRKHIYKEKIQEISKYSKFPLKLYERLPHYLGLDIENILERNTNIRYLISIDSFEQLLGNGSSSDSEWLRELIGSIGRGLYIILGREKISWGEISMEWNSIIHTKCLKRLSVKDCYKFLENFPSREESVISEIVTQSKGVPFLIDRLVDLYTIDSEIFKEKISSQIHLNEPNEIIYKFIDHLSKELKLLVKVSAVFGIFNFEIINLYSKEYNLVYSEEEINSFLNLSIIENVGLSKYRMHQVLQDFLFTLTSRNFKSEVFNFLLTYVANRGIYIFPSDIIIELFLRSINLCIELKFKKIEFFENLIRIGFHLIDKGHWFQLEKLTNKYKRRSVGIGAGLNLIRGICNRRIKRIDTGYYLILKSLSKKQYLGRYDILAKSELAYLECLRGKYETGIKIFNELKNENLEEYYFDSRNIYWKITEYYIDALFLVGQFKTALMECEDAINKLVYSRENDLLSKFYRIKGHIFRFNFYLEEAKLNYNNSLEWSETNKYYIGRISTNFLETLCYTYNSDNSHWFTKSLKNNESVRSSIEIGKTYTAQSIIDIVNKDYKSANVHIKKALKLHIRLGYEAGILFTSIAQFYLNFSKEDKNKYEEAYTKIKIKIKKIKVYEFLLLGPAIAMKDVSEIAQLSQTIQWIDFEKTTNQIQSFLDLLRTK